MLGLKLQRQLCMDDADVLQPDVHVSFLFCAAVPNLVLQAKQEVGRSKRDRQGGSSGRFLEEKMVFKV